GAGRRPRSVRGGRAGERAAGRGGRAGGQVGPAEADAGRGIYARAAGGPARRGRGGGPLGGGGRGEGPGGGRGAPGGGARGAGDGDRRAREQLAAIEYGRTIQVAYEEWREGNVPATLSLLDSTRADLRGWEWCYVHRLCHSDRLTFKGHTGPLSSASFSPDGT